MPSRLPLEPQERALVRTLQEAGPDATGQEVVFLASPTVGCSCYWPESPLLQTHWSPAIQCRDLVFQLLPRASCVTLGTLLSHSVL